MRKYWKITDTENDTYVLVPDSQALVVRVRRCKTLMQAYREFNYGEQPITYQGVVGFWRTETELAESFTTAKEFDDAFVAWLETHDVDYETAYDEAGNVISEESEKTRVDLDPLP